MSKIPKYALLSLLMLLCFNSFSVIGNSYETQAPEFKETIYVQVFFAFPPGETMLVKNCILEFENILDGPPINTSLQAFGDSFIKADFKGMGYFMTIDTYHHSSIGVERAYNYAEEIAQEFLRVFDFSNLQRIAGSHQIDEATNTIKIRQQFKHTTPSVVQILLKYKPQTGFGKFVDNLVPKYVPATDKSGLIDLYYVLRKSESGFSWKFVIGGSEGKTLLNEKTEEMINLNELLNNSLPILASTHRSSIIIDVQKNRNRQIGDSVVTYSLTIKDIYPGGYQIIDKENYKQIKYEDLTTPLDDVIVKVEVGKTIPPHDYTLAIAVGVIGTIAIIAVACAKKRKIKKQT